MAGTKTPNSNSMFYCPYPMYQFRCPFNNQYRQKVEEYPIQQQAAPTSPPPNYTPKLANVPTPNLSTVEFGIINPCIFKYTYLWLKNGDEFWSYLVYISRTAIAGWRYQGGRWVYFTLDLSDLRNFTCSQ